MMCKFSVLSRNVPGVYIKDLIPGSVASLDGQLRIDDRILEVNSDDLSILSQEHAANHIQVLLLIDQSNMSRVWEYPIISNYN